MGGEKKFFDVFARYKPSAEKRALLERGHSARFRYTKDPMRVEVDLSFDSHEDAELIYEIEDECRELYLAESFKILPHFAPECFDVSRFDEIACEAALCGAVTNGFFTGAKYFDDGEKITVSIPFCDSGVDFVRRSNSEAILSNILRSRYGVDRTVSVVCGDGNDERHKMWEEKRQQRMIDAERESRERFIADRERMAKEREEQARAADPTYDFEAKSGISSETGTAEAISDTEYKMGATVYSFEGSESIFGDDFVISEPTPLSDVAKSKGRAIFLGTAFDVSMKETRAGDKTNCTIGISDGASAIYVKKTLPNEELDWIKGLKKGTHLAVAGRVMTDKFDGEAFLSPVGIKKISIVKRTDKAPEKRVELHLHTNMSQMDAIITPAELVETALRWGHKAIAVTDHGNVQAFPEVMLALEKTKSDLKILYGTEAYFVNDTAKCIFGRKYPAFNEEMVVFDIETTGLSNRTCKIIEIGAVKIKDGEVIDKFNIFVDPETPIPEEITRLTSITDEDVKGAPKEREALEQFLSFAGDSLLIAHNANFDIGFIRVAAERQEMPFNNSYLDTVGLSRYVNPELKNHKLDTIVEYYKIGEFHHHRASDDAEVLARIFIEMLKRLKKEGILDFNSVINAMSETVDPIKLVVSQPPARPSEGAAVSKTSGEKKPVDFSKMSSKDILAMEKEIMRGKKFDI